ncbi:hypothetical protein FOL47_001849, partial [Perkinsus chesapeaki]
NLYSDVKFGIVDTLPHGADLLLNHQCSQKLRIPVAPPCEDKSWEDIDKVILENVSPEWEPIEAAPGFSIRLRELSEGEAKECPSQRFCFDVSVSPLDDPNDARHNINDSPWPSNVVDFGFKIYNRLSASEKESYDKAVNKFVDAGYWVPVDDDVVSHDSTAPKVVSFPVKQVDDSASDGPTKVISFKVRPVIQAVGVNRVIKAGGARKASYSGDSVAEILLGLRLNFSRAGEGPLGLLSLDVGKAFYRFRLMARSDSRGDVVSSLGYLYIRAAGKWYRCDRLAFGLLHGPASLQSGLATLLRLAGKLDPSLAVLPVYSFYDDIMVPIPLTKVPELLSTILPLAERVGLVIPSDQIALLSDAAERICGITCDHGWGLRLGNLMRVRQNDLQIRCLVKKIDFVKNFELKADKTTRRDVSRLTGSAQASNILRLHPVRALASSAPVVWWPTIAGDIARFVRNCLGCAREHARHIAPCGYSEVVRSRRWDTVYIDFCGPIDGWTYTCPSSNTIIRPASVFVIIDTLTGWVELCPCADQTAHTASRLLLERWISRFGIPNEIRSDRDQAFLSSIQSSICRLPNIDQVFSGGLSPASQGVVESAVRSLKRHLERSFTTDLTLLPWLQRSLNAARKSHAGALPVSPEILLYGESTSGGLESLLCASSDAFPKFNPDTLTKEVKDTVEVFCRAWSEDLAIQRAKRVDRLNADGNLAQLQELAPGDTVFRVTKNGLGRTKATGPFIFESMDGNMVRLSGIRHAIPLHQVRLCSVTPTGNLGCCPDPPDPHGLLAGPRRDLKEGSLVLFVTPEWETTDDGSELEITAYDVGKLVKNDYPNMSIQRFYIDESGRWKDWKNPETVNVHSSQ